MHRYQITMMHILSISHLGSTFVHCLSSLLFSRCHNTSQPASCEYPLNSNFHGSCLRNQGEKWKEKDMNPTEFKPGEPGGCYSQLTHCYFLFRINNGLYFLSVTLKRLVFSSPCFTLQTVPEVYTLYFPQLQGRAPLKLTDPLRNCFCCYFKLSVLSSWYHPNILSWQF